MNNDTIHIAVCDDNIKSAEIIKEVVFEKFSTDCKVTIETFYATSQLKERLKQKTFNLIFLDIDMPAEDGIDFAVKLREEKYSIDLIFVSNREDRVFDSFKVQPFGFVRKSRFSNEITSIIERYKNKFFDNGARIVVFKTSNSNMRVCADDIIYIECVRDTQSIHLISGEIYKITSRMNIIEQQLHSFGFIRVHSGYLVNYKFFKRFEGLSVLLTNGDLIPISRRRLSEVKQQYMQLIFDDGTIIV